MRHHTTKRPSCNGYSHNNWPLSAQQLKPQYIRAIEKRDATGRGRWRTFRQQVRWWNVSLGVLDAIKAKHGVKLFDPRVIAPLWPRDIARFEGGTYAAMTVERGTYAALRAFAEEIAAISSCDYHVGWKDATDTPEDLIFYRYAVAPGVVR